MRDVERIMFLLRDVERMFLLGDVERMFLLRDVEGC